MRLLDRLERRWGRWAVGNVTLALVIGQIACYVLGKADAAALDRLAFVPSLFLAGEFWRPFSFVFQPPQCHPVFAFFAWYLFYLMGTALEHTWGAFRYNVFLLTGYVATVAVAFLTPDAPASVAFLGGSVFLAFAYLYPNFQLLLMFILPVRIKWLALITWIVYGWVMIVGPMPARILIGASVVNFFLFFGGDVARRMWAGHRTMRRGVKQIAQRTAVRHRCAICGVTNLTDPTMEFRYCSKCAGTPCYCAVHLRNHEHVVDAASVQPAGRGEEE
ncbi:MAG: hypothetical protein JW809_07475 [Pirellulales bacterium]|nr:hypothetical protein [Pirellulales bacterium]